MCQEWDNEGDAEEEQGQGARYVVYEEEIVQEETIEVSAVPRQASVAPRPAAHCPRPSSGRTEALLNLEPAPSDTLACSVWTSSRSASAAGLQGPRQLDEPPDELPDDGRAHKWLSTLAGRGR